VAETILRFDDEVARRVEAVYLTPDVVAQRKAVLAALAPAFGEAVVDVGSGPGYLVAGIARAVGAAGRVAGIEIWDSVVWRSSDDERMRRVLAAWEEHLAHPRLPRVLPDLLRAAGLELADARAFPILNAGFDADTYSAGLLELVASFVAGRQGVGAEEARAWADDLRSLGGSYFFSLNRYLFLACKPG
jgi:SAM-dependent methyltransferase